MAIACHQGKHPGCCDRSLQRRLPWSINRSMQLQSTLKRTRPCKTEYWVLGPSADTPSPLRGLVLTPEELQNHVSEQSRRVAFRYGLNGSDLESASIIKIIESDKWRTHPNPTAYCNTIINTSAIDLLRRQAVEAKHLEQLLEEAGNEPPSHEPAEPDHPSDLASENNSNSGVDAKQDKSNKDDPDSNRKEKSFEGKAVQDDIDSRVAIIAEKLLSVDWGRSTLRPYLLLDARMLIAKQLLALKDDELHHIGECVNHHLSRSKFVEAIMPWGGDDALLILGDSKLTIQVAWEKLTAVIEASAAYHHATRRDKKSMAKVKLNTVAITACLRTEWPDLKDNTWTTKCVRAWKKVAAQFPEIKAELKPHSRGNKKQGESYA